MSYSSSSFTPIKKTLSNGLTVLIKPVNHLPRIETHMWYNVGSKHESHNEKGMAHLIEHMLFKGTALLSETDINHITHKLSGYSNAFTSQDCTSYVFRLPSSVWEHALVVFAQCMKEARFDPQHLSSEIKTVVEELRLYRDDYYSSALEELIATLFSEHPYHYPIIGSSSHLTHLNRDQLFNFYQHYYHPNNATLVIIGDVIPKQALTLVEKHLGHIPAGKPPSYHALPIHNDIIAKEITLYRDVSTPWVCYCYTVPGLQDQKNHLHDLVALILGGNKSSRLYQKLVVEHQYAVDVDCFTYEFFEKGLFCIALYPIDEKQIPAIEKIVEQEIENLSKEIASWELAAAQKNLLLDTLFIFESIEKQATIIGNSFMATNDEQAVSSYFNNIEQTSEQDLQVFIKEYLRPSIRHSTTLRSVSEQEKIHLKKILAEKEQSEQALLTHHNRTEPIEPGNYVHSLPYPPITDYFFPVPDTQTLDNGLNLITHNNPHMPYVYIILNFKSNPYYDIPEKAGLFTFLLLLMTTRTQSMDATTFNKKLQQEGIRLYPSFDGIKIYCLKQDLEKSLSILYEVLTKPSYDEITIEQVRGTILNEINLFWDSPTELIDQLAREHIYAQHPYSKNPLGSEKSISSITDDDLKKCHQTLISPQESTLLLVGDIPDQKKAQSLIAQTFDQWKGNSIETITPHLTAQHKPTTIHHEMNRDQIVLTLTRDTITSLTDDYYPLLLLDIILTGGAGASTDYRLFNLREETGLFYTIDGSLIYGNGIRPNIMIIKTIVSPDHNKQAQEQIQKTLMDLHKNGVSLQEFELAKNLLLSSSVELFETNTSRAHTFLFLKKCNLPFNLFDKQGALLSILKHEDVNEVARRYCNPQDWSVVTVGRSVSKRSPKKGD